MICEFCGQYYKNKTSLAAHKGAKHKQDLLNIEVFPGITKAKLNELRSKHTTCMICGKVETANTRPDTKDKPNKLCADHNHITGKFRGFLCVQCNRNIGWYDKYQKQIFSYIEQTKYL